MSPSRDINPLTIEYFTFQDDMIWKLSEKELIDYAEKELRLTGLISKNDEVLDGFIIRSLDAYPVIRKGHQTYVDIIKTSYKALKILLQLVDLVCLNITIKIMQWLQVYMQLEI